MILTREQATQYIKSQSPSAFMPPDNKRKGYVCPKCGSGSGRNGTGMSKNPKDGRYRCWSCNFNGDTLDLIGGQYGLDDFNAKLQKGCEIYGIQIEQSNNYQASAPQKAAVSAVNPSDDKVKAYVQACHDRADQTDYFRKRGITKDSIDRFQLGYDPAFKERSVGGHTWSAIVIPTSDVTYEVRNTKVDPNSPTDGGNKYRKHGPNRLFNVSSLQEEKSLPIVVCEGIIDAISVIQSGGQAVALGSASNYQSLLDALDKVVPAKPLVLLLDDDKAGRDAAGKLAAELTKRNIPYIQPTDVLTGYHDANDRLLNDPDGLKDAIAKAYTEAYALPDPKEVAKEEYLSTSAGRSVDAFLEAIKANAKRPRLSTGFADLDVALDGGFYTGLYFIGAISSLGKTTLTLQFADNLAQQGRDVLVFTLEQSKADLMSKSISRETFLACKRHGYSQEVAKTNLGIWDGRRWKNYNDQEKAVIDEAVTVYRSYADHIFFYEGVGTISVDFIREKVRNHISLTGNQYPIVIIDYLQIIKAGEGDDRATDKQIVDHNVTALKQLSRDFDIPVIAVSSLNRANYSEEINMAAFKESGAIEYGSDVLIGLQLTGAGDKNFDVAKAKAESPRKIDFCILKNRNGKITTDGIKMTFYAMFNCFMGSNGVNGDDGFVPLSKADEDELPFGGFESVPDGEEDEIPFN